MSTRIAAACGFLAPVTYCAALVFGHLAQPDAFSSADDAISDLGAETASSAWIYNQVGVNLTGVLIMVVGLGLWQALSPDLLGRLGAVTVTLAGLTLFLQGFFRLDCQGIDVRCDNTSWHADAHSVATGVSAAFIFVSPIVLAFAFRRLSSWRNAWLPTLAVVPASIAASALFSLLGSGAANRAGALTWLLWLGYIGLQLLRKGDEVATVTQQPGDRIELDGVWYVVTLRHDLPAGDLLDAMLEVAPAQGAMRGALRVRQTLAAAASINARNVRAASECD